MLRQIGLAIGVAVLIALIGSPHSPARVLAAYQRGWVVIAAASLVGGLAALALLAAGRRTHVALSAPAVSVPAASDSF
jgi:hypothetical protein